MEIKGLFNEESRGQEIEQIIESDICFELKDGQTEVIRIYDSERNYQEYSYRDFMYAIDHSMKNGS